MRERSLAAFAVSALAAWRVTRFVTEDELAAPLRDAVEKRFGPPSESKLTYLVYCPHCVGVYASAAVVLADTMFPQAWRPVESALALAGVSSLLSELRR